ncbi:MAG: hypothetical protein JWN89_110 [Parcubacteria group bacterium]|nr:hypothetical protein [Parcubacteria group bacterium]
MARRAYTCLGDTVDNPILAFYSELLPFLKNEEEDTRMARKIDALYQQVPSPPSLMSDKTDGTFAASETHSAYWASEVSSQDIFAACLADLSGQLLRNEAAQAVLARYMEYFNLHGDSCIFLRITRAQALGSGVTKITLLTTSTRWLEDFEGEAKLAFPTLGSVHVSGLNRIERG